jgi:hypothetical protein
MYAASADQRRMIFIPAILDFRWGIDNRAVTISALTWSSIVGAAAVPAPVTYAASIFHYYNAISHNVE